MRKEKRGMGPPLANIPENQSGMAILEQPMATTMLLCDPGHGASQISVKGDGPEVPPLATVYSVCRHKRPTC